MARTRTSPAPEHRRSPCPVACALDVFGDRWTLLLIRDMAGGKTTFSQFASSPEKMATNILAARLEKLVVEGLAARRPRADHAGRDEYVLTPRGLSLLPLLGAIADWGLANIPGTEARLRPSPEQLAGLVHTASTVTASPTGGSRRARSR